MNNPNFIQIFIKDLSIYQGFTHVLFTYQKKSDLRGVSRDYQPARNTSILFTLKITISKATEIYLKQKNITSTT